MRARALAATRENSGEHKKTHNGKPAGENVHKEAKRIKTDGAKLAPSPREKIVGNVVVKKI